MNAWQVTEQTDEEYRSKFSTQEEWDDMIGNYYQGDMPLDRLDHAHYAFLPSKSKGKSGDERISFP
jgi:GH18 family chitinase